MESRHIHFTNELNATRNKKHTQKVFVSECKKKHNQPTKLYWWQTVANQLNQCYLNIKRDCYLLTITHAPKNLDMKSIGINTQDMEKNTNWLIDYRAQSHSLNVFIHFKITIITHWYPQQMIVEKEWFHIMAVGFNTFSSHPECEPNWVYVITGRKRTVPDSFNNI